MYMYMYMYMYVCEYRYALVGYPRKRKKTTTENWVSDGLLENPTRFLQRLSPEEKNSGQSQIQKNNNSTKGWLHHVTSHTSQFSPVSCSKSWWRLPSLPSLAICHAAVDADGLVGNHQHVGGASQGQCEGSLRQSGTLQPAANAVLGVGQQAQVPEMAAPDPSDWRSDLETRGFCSNMR